jgi:hypothetical protein
VYQLADFLCHMHLFTNVGNLISWFADNSWYWIWVGQGSQRRQTEREAWTREKMDGTGGTSNRAGTGGTLQGVEKEGLLPMAQEEIEENLCHRWARGTDPRD